MPLAWKEVRRGVALALASAAFFMGYYTRLAWSILSSYAGYSASSAATGLVFSLFFAAYIAVQIPAGLASDRAGPKPVLIASLLGLAASTALAGAATSDELMYLASALMGASAGWIYPASVKLISALYRGSELPKAMALYSLAWPLSIALLGVTAPEAATALGWRGAYLAMAAVDVALALALLKSPNPRAVGARISLAGLRNRDAALLAAGGFIFFTAYWAFAFYIYDYLEELGMSSGLAGLIYSLTAVGGIPSTIAAGWIISRLGVRRTYAIFLPLYGATLAAYAAPLGAAYFAALSLAAGFMRFVITPANSTAAGLIGGERAGSVSGLANLFWQAAGIAAGAAPLIIGALGFRAFWIVAGALSASAALVLSRLRI